MKDTETREPVRKARMLIGLAAGLNGAVGSGEYDHISIEDVKTRIADLTVFDYLGEQLGQEVNDHLGLLSADDTSELLEQWALLMSIYDEREKLCVTRGGLCLLVAYLLEGLLSLWEAQADDHP